jgi:hypothetical protein
MTTVPDVSVTRTARVAGALHLSLVPFGIFSFVYVPAALIVRSDAAVTAANIAAATTFYRLGIISHLISQIIVVFLMAMLFRLFAPIDNTRATLVGACGVIGVAVSFAAELNQFAVLQSLSDPSRVMLFLELHRAGVLLAQVFWGLWLLVASTLIVRSHLASIWLAVLVLAGAGGYLFDSFAYFSGLQVTPISSMTFAGELALPVWLLFNARRFSSIV